MGGGGEWVGGRKGWEKTGGSDVGGERSARGKGRGGERERGLD